MANTVRAMCTAMSMGARWPNTGTMTGLILIRSAILSMRCGGARFLASVGALPPMGQQFLDSTVQLRRQSGEHVLQVGPRLMPVELGRLQQDHHHRRTFSGQLAADEEPVAPTKGECTERRRIAVLLNVDLVPEASVACSVSMNASAGQLGG